MSRYWYSVARNDSAPAKTEKKMSLIFSTDNTNQHHERKAPSEIRHQMQTTDKPDLEKPPIHQTSMRATRLSLAIPRQETIDAKKNSICDKTVHLISYEPRN
jgi:hypothetical protein